MELNWSTFVFEIINFVVLVWILKRFLYRPVMSVIEQRQAAINEKLDYAESLKTKSDELLKTYDNRLSDWAREKQALRQAFEHELQQERATRMQQLRDELEAEHRKAEAIEQQKQADHRQQAESAAITMASRFAAKLFAELSGPEVERRLIKLFLDQLQAMPEERRRTIESGITDDIKEVVINTAYALDSSDSRMLEATIRQLVGDDANFIYTRTPELLAGLKVTLGAFVLQANLKDELNDFARFSDDTIIH